LGGVEALHEPLQVMVPELVCPQALGALVQAFPYPLGLAGAEALHEPLQVMVPELH
jgi:hypothetical protein